MSKFSFIRDLVSAQKAALFDQLTNAYYYRERRLTPRVPRHDDVYVVSFPKSGATWMNFLMANIHSKMSGRNQKVTLFNVHDFIPDINQDRDISPEPLPFPGVRVFKSHSDFNPYYKKVVLIVRDPRDTLVSYYHFLRGLDSFSGSLSQLVVHPEFGIDAWVRHTKGWLEKTSASVPLHLVRYEDLHGDVTAQLALIYRKLGYDVPEEVLADAVANSSFEVLKKMEREDGNAMSERFPNFQFFRKGKSERGAEMTAADQQYICEKSEYFLKMFGYL